MSRGKDSARATSPHANLSVEIRATARAVSHCHLRYLSAFRCPTHMAKMAKTRSRQGLSALIGLAPSRFGQMSIFGESVPKCGWHIVPARCNRGKISQPEACRNWSINSTHGIFSAYCPPIDERHELIAGRATLRAAQKWTCRSSGDRADSERFGSA